jgi:NADH-quinone oxidoreductase subunit G
VGGRAADQPGRDARSLLEDGGLEAALLLGVEPELDGTAGEGVLETLAETEFVVCLTPYASPAMRRYADALLPVGTAYETSGTFVNCEGRWQSFTGAARPVGEARPAWKVLRVLGTQLGIEGFDYMSSEEVRDDLSGRLAAAGTPVPEVPLRAVRLEQEGAWQEPGACATDMLLRRSRPLQETKVGQAGGRRWP